MTDFTPEIRVMYLPPNTIHSATKTEITTWVDYNINISRGTDEYINPPYPGGCTLSLLFDENYVPDIELGSWIEIQVKNSSGTWIVLQAGNVVNRSSQYRSFGIAGFVLEWQFVITSTISLLQNTTFYVNQYVESTTDGLVSYVEEESTVLNWFAINRELTWENFGPQAWDEVDTYRQNDFPVFNYGLDTNDQALDEGSYNTWDTLVKLVYGVYGWIYEGSDGELYFNYGETALTSEMTFTADMLNPDLIGGDRFESLRNIVEITKFDADRGFYTAIDHYNPDSVNSAWVLRSSFDSWQAAKAQAVPDGFVVVPIAPILKILDAASSLAPIKTMIEAQEQNQ